SDIRFEILKRLREAGIEIPFPQRDLNIKGIERLQPAAARPEPEPEPEGEPEPERSDTSGIPEHYRISETSSGPGNR
ncbi:MAG: hypothetical protein IH603_18410, partial [Burkholderia vietnamiensis]|nr:hypothetical protein [Burkholderia vietnamiensis]